jgi:hypothetical protein
MNRKSKRYVVAKVLVGALCLAIILVAVAALSPANIPTAHAKAVVPVDLQTTCAPGTTASCYRPVRYIRRCLYATYFCDTYYNAIPPKTYCYPYSTGW